MSLYVVTKSTDSIPTQHGTSSYKKRKQTDIDDGIIGMHMNNVICMYL